MKARVKRPLLCPRCKAELSDDEVRKLWSSRNEGKRDKLSGGRNGGRPPLPRCACGKYTARLAEIRKHVCVAP